MAQGKFPLDNLTYNLVTIIHEKSKALEAYDHYVKDAQQDQEVSRLLQEIRQSDERWVRELSKHLNRCLSKAVEKAA